MRGTASGLCLGEASFQGALAYARERLQMRALTGPVNPDGPADPIIVHPEVRRMLMTQKSLVEGSRAFIAWLSRLNDHTRHGTDEQAAEAEDLMALLTPVAKAFCTSNPSVGAACSRDQNRNRYRGHRPFLPYMPARANPNSPFGQELISIFCKDNYARY